jgi:hypothetical protein
VVLNVLFPPLQQLIEHGIEAPSGFGERVLHFGGHFGIDGSVHDADLLEVSQLLNEHFLVKGVG